MVLIHNHLNSETIHLPDGAALMGKDVRIIVVQEPAAGVLRDLSAPDRLAGKIDMDYEASEELSRWSVV